MSSAVTAVPSGSWTIRLCSICKHVAFPKKEARALLTYAFANNVLSSVAIPSVKSRINALIAKKLGVNLGFNL